MAKARYVKCFRIGQPRVDVASHWLILARSSILLAAVRWMRWKRNYVGFESKWQKSEWFIKVYSYWRMLLNQTFHWPKSWGWGGGVIPNATNPGFKKFPFDGFLWVQDFPRWFFPASIIRQFCPFCHCWTTETWDQAHNYLTLDLGNSSIQLEVFVSPSGSFCFAVGLKAQLIGESRLSREMPDRNWLFNLLGLTGVFVASVRAFGLSK
jgi:hypothetical protein